MPQINDRLHAGGKGGGGGWGVVSKGKPITMQGHKSTIEIMPAACTQDVLRQEKSHPHMNSCF